jgi:hypothetical protein
MEQLNDMVKKILIQILVCPIIAGFGSSLIAEEKNVQNPSNDKDYCIICHERQAKKSLKKPVAEWQASVHTAKGGSCSMCHGGDPGADDKVKAKSKFANFVGRPDRKKISEFCGRKGCHAPSLEQFKQGPHYQSVLKTGEPGCTTCHGVHGIRHSAVESITEQSCTACHSVKFSKETVGIITRLGRSLNSIDKNVAVMMEENIDVKAIQDRLKNAHRLFDRFVHVLSRQEMESTRNILEMEITSLDTDSKSKATSIQRIDTLYMIMVTFCLLVIGGFLVYIIVMYSRRKK